jgi:hypothetical protein
MNNIGRDNLRNILLNYSGSVRHVARINVGATNTNIPLKDTFLQPNSFDGLMIQILDGPAFFEWSTISSTGFTSITLSNPVTVPNENDIIVIYNYKNSSTSPTNTNLSQWGGTPLTGADITPNITNLDLALSTLQTNLLADIGNITQWGGTALTGADITTNIQNLDLALTDLRDSIRGSGNRTISDLYVGNAEGLTIAASDDISGGVSQNINQYMRWTLYFKVVAAIDITVELSPDGSTYYEIDESPISFSSSGDKVFEIGYTGTNIRFTGSNTTSTTIQLSGKIT